MADFSINEMQEMQKALQDKYKDQWEPICPEIGQNKLLWMIGEIGEVIDIVKKHGGGKASSNEGLRKDLIEEMADVLMYYNDVLLCYGITADELKQTKVTQPAVFLHSVILAKVLGVEPVAVAGHSLGEFSALVVAGALSFEDGLRLVAKRAMAMQRACEIEQGTMAAVLRLPDETIEQVCQSIDGVVVGSPVYYAGPNGSLCALLDRLFYSCSALMAYKPAAAVAVCRRGGASATFDRLNKYFTINNMPVVPSQYWNSVHGAAMGEALEDLEGLQTMRTLGKNMAWMLRGFNHVELPISEEPKLKTSFVR